MNVEFIIGERYMHWIELGWETNDELGFPLAISINLSALYAQYGNNEVCLIDEIIHVIEHEMIHYSIHIAEPDYWIDHKEIVEILQTTTKGKACFTGLKIPKEDEDYLVGYA